MVRFAKSVRRKPFYKSSVRTRTKVRGRTTAGSRKTGLSSGQKAFVKRLIFKNKEKSMAVRTQSLTEFNGSIDSMADVYNLYPTVSQGTGEVQREGNSIRATHLHVRGHIQIDPADLATVWNSVTNPIAGVPPLYVTIFILRNKIRKNYADFSAADLNILDLGQSYGQFDGTVANSYAPINKDRYQLLYRKVCKLTAPYVSNTNGAMTGVAFPNELVRLFSKTIKLNKVLKYAEDDTQGTYPMNDNLIMCIGYSNTFSGTVDNLTTTKVKAQWQSRLYFTEY